MNNIVCIWLKKKRNLVLELQKILFWLHQCFLCPKPLGNRLYFYSSLLWSQKFPNLGDCNFGHKVTIPVLFVLPRERGVEKLWFLIRFIGSSISGLHRNIHSSSFFIIKGILIKTVLASWVEWISVPTSLVLDIYLLQTILPIIVTLIQSQRD